MSAENPSGEKIRKPVRFGLRLRLVLGFTLIFSVVFSAAFYWFYQFTTTRAIQRIQRDMESTALGAASGLNPELLTLLAENGEPNGEAGSDHPAYEAQLAWFELVRSVEPRAWPYTYVKGDEVNEILWQADLWIDYDPARAVVFDESFFSEGFLSQGLNELTAYIPTDERGFEDEVNPTPLVRILHALNLINRVGYSDEWGRWISVYAPVLDETGVTVGGIGIDFEADYVDEVQDAILATTARAFAITYLFLFFLVFLFSGVITSPIQALTEIAERIGEGDYNQNLGQLSNKRFKDEISKLAEVFEIMVDKVKQREETLKKEVVQLKIEIDESKRQKQVDAIIDSDSFQDLKKRANALRNRRQSKAAVETDS
jgi:HAMP domain-containing protein